MHEVTGLFSKFDLQDIIVFDIDEQTNYKVVNIFNVADHIVRIFDPKISMSSISTEVIGMNVGKMEVVVNDSTYEYLEHLREETRFNAKYINHSKAEYLKDLNQLDEQSRYSWIEVLKENRQCNIKYISNRSKLKVLAEVRLEAGYEVATYVKNLTVAKALGYTGILVRFDTTEDKSELRKVVDIAID